MDRTESGLHAEMKRGSSQGTPDDPWVVRRGAVCPNGWIGHQKPGQPIEQAGLGVLGGAGVTLHPSDTRGGPSARRLTPVSPRSSLLQMWPLDMDSPRPHVLHPSSWSFHAAACLSTGYGWSNARAVDMLIVALLDRTLVCAFLTPR